MLLRLGIMGLHPSERPFHFVEHPYRVGDQIRIAIALMSRNQMSLTLNPKALVRSEHVMLLRADTARRACHMLRPARGYKLANDGHDTRDPGACSIQRFASEDMVRPHDARLLQRNHPPVRKAPDWLTQRTIVSVSSRPHRVMRCLLLMLWTAPPPARECHGYGCC
jgi:hypothetical protein